MLDVSSRNLAGYSASEIAQAAECIKRRRGVMPYMRKYYLQLRNLKTLSIVVLLLILIATLALDVILLHKQSTSGESSSSQTRAIVQENSLPGTTSWQMTKETRYNTKTFRSPVIEGYAWGQ